MRLSDPQFTKIMLEARIATLRGGRPVRDGRHTARQN
jgi:hypothetical protein